MKKLLQVIRGELGWLLGVRFIVMHFLLRALPSGTSGRMRAAIYRAFGWRVGPKTVILGTMSFSCPENARRNLSMGEHCVINAFVHIDTTDCVTLGSGVSIGHHALLITANHEIALPNFRAGHLSPRPITVGSGAWIAAGAIILPGVTVGEGSVVGAGAVVTRDVPANCVVAGVPARVVRELAGEAEHVAALRMVN